jgi:dienelactone hydrolase
MTRMSARLAPLLVAAALLTAGCGQVESFSTTDDAAGRAIGHMRRPSGPGPFPAVVMLHGGAGPSPNHVEWADWLSGEGYVAMAIDSVATRGGVAPAASVMAGDAAGALRHLKSLPYVDSDRVGMIGFSRGGAAVLLGVSTLRGEPPIAPGFRAGIAFYPAGCSHRITSTETALLVLYAGHDGSPEACFDMRDRLRATSRVPVAIHVYPNAYHAFDVLEIRTPMQNPATNMTLINLGDPAVAADARVRVRAFLAEHLRGAR